MSSAIMRTIFGEESVLGITGESSEQDERIVMHKIVENSTVDLIDFI
jgi:hypothetical protein